MASGSGLGAGVVGVLARLRAGMVKERSSTEEQLFTRALSLIECSAQSIPQRGVDRLCWSQLLLRPPYTMSEFSILVDTIC